MPDGTIEPKKGRKFDQVLEGARQVFLCDGFEGASVDDLQQCLTQAYASAPFVKVLPPEALPARYLSFCSSDPKRRMALSPMDEWAPRVAAVEAQWAATLPTMRV